MLTAAKAQEDEKPGHGRGGRGRGGRGRGGRGRGKTGDTSSGDGPKPSETPDEREKPDQPVRKSKNVAPEAAEPTEAKPSKPKRTKGAPELAHQPSKAKGSKDAKENGSEAEASEAQPAKAKPTRTKAAKMQASKAAVSDEVQPPETRKEPAVEADVSTDARPTKARRTAGQCTGSRCGGRRAREEGQACKGIATRCGDRSSAHQEDQGCKGPCIGGPCGECAGSRPPQFQEATEGIGIRTEKVQEERCRGAEQEHSGHCGCHGLQESCTQGYPRWIGHAWVLLCRHRFLLESQCYGSEASQLLEHRRPRKASPPETTE